MENQIQNPTTDSIFDEMKPLPVYYSENAILGFSFFCSTLFGAILMAMNASKTPSKKGVWPSIIFGLLFTAAQLTVSLYFSVKGSGPILFGIVGGSILKKFFWEKYIGEKVPYTKRSIVNPVIIAIVFFGGMIALAVIAARS